MVESAHCIKVTEDCLTRVQGHGVTTPGVAELHTAVMTTSATIVALEKEVSAVAQNLLRTISLLSVDTSYGAGAAVTGPASVRGLTTSGSMHIMSTRHTTNESSRSLARCVWGVRWEWVYGCGCSLDGRAYFCARVFLVAHEQTNVGGVHEQAAVSSSEPAVPAIEHPSGTADLTSLPVKIYESPQMSTSFNSVPPEHERSVHHENSPLMNERGITASENVATNAGCPNTRQFRPAAKFLSTWSLWSQRSAGHGDASISNDAIEASDTVQITHSHGRHDHLTAMGAQAGT